MLDATPFLRAYASLRSQKLARKSAAEHQAQTLRKLVWHAQNTKFGQDHNFAEIRSVADYQASVPLRSFEDFRRDYFAASFPLLDDVTWPGRIPYFAASSGTSSGRTKHIPISAEMIRSNSRAGTDLLAHHVRWKKDSDVLGGKSFMLGGSVGMEDLGEGVMSGDLSGIARLNNPRWSAPYVFPNIEEALEADWENKIDRLARLSLDEKIHCIAGTPSWLLLFFERLRAVTDAGKNVKAFYPALDLMVYGGMSFAPYRDIFAEWFPDDDVDWREVYSASEGFVASADRGIDDGMRLNLDIGLFFEFVPIAEWDDPNPTRYWIGNAPPGEYGLILSTCAGLWAYKIGDVVELMDADPPRVKVTGRTSYYLSAFGEHLSGHELEAGVLAAAREIGRNVSEFSVMPLYPGEARSKGQHLFVVELDETPDAGDAARFTKALDAALAAGNEDYEVHRAGDVQLLPPDVAFVAAGGFADWMRARGKLGGQNKVPRVLVDGDVRESLLNFAQEKRVQF
ncbi:GH3 auxin-responsive promoter family protein [Acuticoccus sp. MNP-M23]|uniref:GH3 family domain-containing protein n=1 Tax=Acuticoccus sp. MNP-M23 TaxID=3072793 RepID=UPI002815DBDD|nr:GH3 auxin-responsive promoter family protein [Acuticoccus sp. MNP-M23]WMS43694.1 GH3 auxin-responsive promoter family protein [Acuticoccus sp. MNP-M23]